MLKGILSGKNTKTKIAPMPAADAENLVVENDSVDAEKVPLLEEEKNEEFKYKWTIDVIWQWFYF